MAKLDERRHVADTQHGLTELVRPTHQAMPVMAAVGDQESENGEEDDEDEELFEDGAQRRVREEKQDKDVEHPEWFEEEIDKYDPDNRTLSQEVTTEMAVEE